MWKEHNQHDESVLENLFEDFDGEKSEKQSVPATYNGGMKKTILLALILCILWWGYYIYLASSDIQNWVETTTQPNGSDEIVLIDNSEKQVDENIGEVQNDFNNAQVPVYNDFSHLLSDISWDDAQDSKFSDMWWEENLSKIWSSTLKVAYPKWSYKPSVDPRWGAGFIYNTEKSYDELLLTYVVGFDENFDFVKWGKLPGLCWWECTRWIDWQDDTKWFSVRLAWKKQWYFDAIVNYPGSNQYGDYLWLQSFQFEPWKQYLISQRVKMNTIGESDGVLELKVNGNTLYVKEDVMYRSNSDVVVDSLLFTTFFWGNDESYASPRDTFINFSQFKIQQP